MPRRWRVAVWCCCGLLALTLAHPAAASNPTLHIGLLLRQQSVQVSGEGDFSFVHPAGQRLLVARAGEGWRITPVPAWVWSAPREQAPCPLQPDDEVLLVNAQGKTVAASPLPLTIRPVWGNLQVLGAAADHWDKVSTRSYRGYLQVVRAAHGLTLVNAVDLEIYLRGVVPSEMAVRYPLEALKAQAVAARTECLSCLGRHLVDGADMCNTQHCQVYGGATSEDPRTNQAVEATRGQVLTYQGGIARCVYSAVCGGHTENNEDVWDVAPLPYLRGQPDFDPAAHPELRFPLSGQALADFVANPVDTYCRQSEWSKPEYFRWQVTKSRSELEQALAAAGVRVGSLLALEPLARGVSGRIKSLVVQGSAGQATLGPEYTIRKALGGLRSSNFVASVTTGSDGLPACFTFTGAGWGHGVGMCQIGAVGLAAAGADYRAILARYFPGTTLSADWQIVGGRCRMGR